MGVVKWVVSLVLGVLKLDPVYPMQHVAKR